MQQSPTDLRKLAAASVIALAFSACSSGGDAGSPGTTSAPPATKASAGEEVVSTHIDDGIVRVAVTVSAGAVATDDDRVAVPLGATIELSVTADVDDEVHVHGYELHGDVTPTSAAVITFTADISGVFEVELEDNDLLLVEVEIS